MTILPHSSKADKVFNKRPLPERIGPVDLACPACQTPWQSRVRIAVERIRAVAKRPALPEMLLACSCGEVYVVDLWPQSTASAAGGAIMMTLPPQHAAERQESAGIEPWSIARLQALPNWVVFSIEPQPGGKLKKIPYIPGTQRLANVSDPGTWRTYAEALADAERTGRVPGVTLTPVMGLTLVDIDGRTIHPLIATLDSYTERSISGNGIHILVQGRPPDRFVAPAGVEVYPRERNRFVILTGDVMEGQDTIQDRTELLAALFSPPPPAALPSRAPLSVDDADILQRARAARNGSDFAALFDHGDIGAYGGDASRADQALCSRLSFWTQDADQIDRLFRQSALMRPKWERADYRDGTIRKALQRSEVYEPAPPVLVSDPCAPVRDDLAEARAEIAALKAQNAALTAERDRLSRLQSATMRLLSSSTLRSGEKIIALVSLFEVEAAQSRGATDPDGWSDAPLARLAESGGCSPKVAGKHLTTVASTGILETRTILRHDPQTREVTKHRQVRAPQVAGDPAPSLPERILALSTATPARDPEKQGWGGKRTCPDCGDVGTVTRTVICCKGCGQVLSQTQTEQEPAPAPKDQDDPSVSTSELESLKGHLALSKKSCGSELLMGQVGPSGHRAQRRAQAAADLALREPAWIDDAPPVLDPDPDAPYVPTLLFAPLGHSHHFSAD